LGRSLTPWLTGACLLVALASSPALCDWTEFVPTPVDNGLWTDIFTSWQRYKSGSGGRSTEWTDTFLKEKLFVGSLGYSYHPKFLQYRFTVGGVLSQENYNLSSRRDGGWRSKIGPEYDTRLTLLPEHFYNLVAFAARYEPMYKQQAAANVDQVENRRGITLRYRKKPYFLNTNFVDQSNDFGFITSDVKRLAVNGTYFLRTKAGNELTFNGAFNPSWFDDTQGLNGTSQEYVAGNTVNLKRVRLTSSVVKNFFNQKSPSSVDLENGLQNFESDQFSVYEQLNMFLPWNFRSDAYYRYLDSDSTINDPGFSGPQHLTNRGNDIRANLVHRLYESLDTGYHFERDSRDSGSGSTTSLFHSVNVDYTKLIPWGRLLAGVNVGTGTTDNSGTADTIDEPHSGVPVPGSFRLRSPNVDGSSIVVFLRSPLPPFELVQLVENVDYTLVPMQNTFEIDVLTLPSRFVVPGTYDFLVSYSSLGGDYTLRTNTFLNTGSVQLFDNQVTPYYSYALVRPDVTSGVFPGTLSDTTTYTVGILLRRGPLRARGEYQDLEWDVAPYRSWRGELQYVSPVSRTTDVHATLSYLNKYYPQGTSPGDTTAFTDETTTVSGHLQQKLLFFAEGLSLNVGGSYSRLNGVADGDAYSGDGFLTWVTGQLQLVLGVTAYGSQTSGTGTIETQRENQYVYLRLRRRLL
jgi:hypothetical protein